MHSNSPVILDACVLVQAAVRDTLLRLSERRLFLARWTDRILEEMVNTLLKFGLTQAKVDYLLEELNKHFPDALVDERYKKLIPSMKNEEKDRHVAAAAVKAGCEVIVTYNLKHFKQEHLERLNISARHPDEFLIDLII
jgi:predicted nucleic acid-binding protein